MYLRMRLTLDPGMIALFGSETRAKGLGFLADARTPRTGYAVAAAIGVKPPKVYVELKRLAAGGILEVVAEPGGPARYRIGDGPLREFLVRRGRVTTFVDWFDGSRRQARDQLLEQARSLRVVLPRWKADPASVPNPSEFRRSRSKDLALRRFGSAPRRRIRGRP